MELFKFLEQSGAYVQLQVTNELIINTKTNWVSTQFKVVARLMNTKYMRGYEIYRSLPAKTTVVQSGVAEWEISYNTNDFDPEKAWEEIHLLIGHSLTSKDIVNLDLIQGCGVLNLKPIREYVVPEYNEFFDYICPKPNPEEED